MFFLRDKLTLLILCFVVCIYFFLFTNEFCVYSMYKQRGEKYTSFIASSQLTQAAAHRHKLTQTKRQATRKQQFFKQPAKWEKTTLFHKKSVATREPAKKKQR